MVLAKSDMALSPPPSPGSLPRKPLPVSRRPTRPSQPAFPSKHGQPESSRRTSDTSVRLPPSPGYPHRPSASSLSPPASPGLPGQDSLSAPKSPSLPPGTPRRSSHSETHLSPLPSPGFQPQRQPQPQSQVPPQTQPYSRPSLSESQTHLSPPPSPSYIPYRPPGHPRSRQGSAASVASNASSISKPPSICISPATASAPTSADPEHTTHPSQPLDPLSSHPIRISRHIRPLSLDAFELSQPPPAHHRLSRNSALQRDKLDPKPKLKIPQRVSTAYATLDLELGDEHTPITARTPPAKRTTFLPPPDAPPSTPALPAPARSEAGSWPGEGNCARELEPAPDWNGPYYSGEKGRVVERGRGFENEKGGAQAGGKRACCAVM